MTAIHKRDTAFVETEIDDEKVLMSLADGRFFSLKDTGLAIWDAIDGLRDRAQIAAHLAREYDLSEDFVRADIDEFLATLGGAGLIGEG